MEFGTTRFLVGQNPVEDEEIYQGKWQFTFASCASCTYTFE